MQILTRNNRFEYGKEATKLMEQRKTLHKYQSILYLTLTIENYNILVSVFVRKKTHDQNKIYSTFEIYNYTNM